jgi:hypothetical protein
LVKEVGGSEEASAQRVHLVVGMLVTELIGRVA